MMSQSMLFRAKLELLTRSTDAAYRRYWALPDAAERYKAYLIQLHQLVRASVPLMIAAQRRAEELSPRDPVSALLAPYYEAHIEEERDHDAWILRDLDAIGVRRDDVLERIPPPSVASLAGGQYYWIFHHHPLSLLGYIAVFEEPPPLGSLDELAAKTGLPGDGFRMLREHGRLDPAHKQDLDTLIDALPLAPTHTALLGVSVAHAASGLHDCITAITPGDRSRS